MPSRIDELEIDAKELRELLDSVRRSVDATKSIADQLETEYLQAARPELTLVKGEESKCLAPRS